MPKPREKTSALAEALGGDFFERQETVKGLREALLAPLSNKQVFSLATTIGLPVEEIIEKTGLPADLVAAIKEHPSAIHQEAFLRDIFGKQLGTLKAMDNAIGYMHFVGGFKPLRAKSSGKHNHAIHPREECEGDYTIALSDCLTQAPVVFEGGDNEGGYSDDDQDLWR